MGNEVKFGIIGLGNMGTQHMRYLTQGKVAHGKVVAAADLNPDKIAAFRAAFPGEYACFSSGDQLIESGAVDAVIIATPHYSHPTLAIKAFEHGINVICEKPAGVYAKQVAEMNAAAKKSGKFFTVMFNQRTNPLYKKMRAFVQDGAVGDIKRINWLITTWYRTQSYYDSGSWRATWAGEGGGVLFNQCPHQIDLLQWITGMMPIKVQAHCHFGKWHDIEVEDDVSAYMEFENGATGVFVTSTADTPGTNRFEILGTKGKMVCEDDKLTLYILEQDERIFVRESKHGFAQPKYTVKEVALEGEYPAHAGITDNFANAILGLEPLFVDGQEGIRGVEIMDAMLLSQWLEKEVSVPVDPDVYLEELNKRIATSKLKKTQDRVFDLAGTYGDKR